MPTAIKGHVVCTHTPGCHRDLRHTCLTRWAPHMDPWTLAYLAGHRDMNITKRYVHPQVETILRAMQNARGGYKNGHSASTGESKGRQETLPVA